MFIIEKKARVICLEIDINHFKKDSFHCRIRKVNQNDFFWSFASVRKETQCTQYFREILIGYFIGLTGTI